jgi:hypothetical protein
VQEFFETHESDAINVGLVVTPQQKKGSMGSMRNPHA